MTGRAEITGGTVEILKNTIARDVLEGAERRREALRDELSRALDVRGQERDLVRDDIADGPARESRHASQDLVAPVEHDPEPHAGGKAAAR